ncbi:MAG: hypothetical protein K2L54_04440, partial [Clostridiales bacterium]|nr:hypothetical protein [Clostridiales bacterium]
MKKLGLFRKFGLTATVVLLCLAMMLTFFVFAVPPVASPLAEAATVSKTEVLKGVNIKDTCDYGDMFDVPSANGATVTVTAPDGETVEVVNNKVTAMQVGNYKITYEQGGLSYDFYVRVSLDEEFFLKVDDNGADIPTYINNNGSIVLPLARVVYYDDNNILQEYQGDYTVIASTSRNTTTYNVKKGKVEENNPAAADRTIELDGTNGQLFITYTAKLGATGTKHFSKIFNVKVQSNVNNTGNPTLSVSGVQKDVSINRAVTLPKATATDSYDDNVKIEIKVLDPQGNPVKNVDIDENGYAYRKEGVTYDDVTFDNDQSMTFYPMETGDYKISYTAYSDAWTGSGNVGKSSTREYSMTVSDLVAPVFKSVDEWRIPETWGKTVYKRGDDGKEELTALGNKIHFTVPEVVDNDPESPITVYFRITDSDNSKTVIEFTNILADDDDSASKYVASSTSSYKADAVFSTENGFDFNFDDYRKVDPKDPNGAELDRVGTYTVLYRARDKANNTSSKTYTIQLQERYTDTAEPTTAEVTAPNYISDKDETLTIPYPEYADASDTRPLVDYRVYTDATLADGEARYIDVKGGEVADIEGGYLVLNKGKTDRKGVSIEEKLKIGDNLYFYIAVTDKVGNYKTNFENNAKLDENAAAEDYKKVGSIVKVISSDEGEFTFNGDDMTFSNANPNKQAGDPLVAGDSVVASGFSITTANKDMRKYTGFEVAVYNPKGQPINATLETFTVPGETNDTIYVKNIKFHASATTQVKGDDGKWTEGDNSYYMTVRVFDVNGNNEVYGYKLGNVAASPDDLIHGSAISAIGSTGDVNVTYKLHNETVDVNGTAGDSLYVVRKISGMAFSLMGTEFTAKKQGSYNVQDGYIFKSDYDNGGYDYDKVKFVGLDQGNYSFKIKDTSAPVFEVQGVMPTYWAKYDSTNEETIANTTVKLPKVIAYTENGMADVELEITYNSESVDYDKETNTFKGVKDGAYKLKYTATASNAQSVEAEYTINIGDVEGPEFTLSGGTSTTATMKVGDTFTFATMKLVDEETGVQITKKLFDPSHEEVTDATVSG